MTGVLRWEDPPPRGGSDRYDWSEIADDLVENQGRWALVAIAPNASTAGQMARRIRDGLYDAMPRGFEATARTVDGEARVYARCAVGDSKPTQDHDEES